MLASVGRPDFNRNDEWVIVSHLDHKNEKKSLRSEHLTSKSRRRRRHLRECGSRSGAMTVESKSSESIVARHPYTYG